MIHKGQLAVGNYRYLLWRYGKPIGEGKSMTIVMLNPSTADGEQDDPTIRKCSGFVKRLGYDNFTVMNVFAFRATKPSKLVHFQGNRVGPDNLLWLATLSKVDVLVAWGVWGSHRNLLSGVEAARDTIKGAKPANVFCLGRTKEGQPRHPLMLPYSTPLEEFEL